MDALREREVRVLGGRLETTVPAVRAAYRRAGVRTICFVPIVFRDAPLGLLVLYHRSDHDWTPDETELARAFADQMATAIGSARLADSSRTMTGRLRAISELAARLNRLQDLAGIGHAIVAEARTLLDHDTIRVYRVDHETGMCEPIAFQGTFMDVEDPDPSLLRVPIGTGLTGWVAKHGETVRLGDAAGDQRTLVVRSTEGPESMLLVPMTFDGIVHGVIVLSKDGLDRFDDDDETTLAIFAGYAAQALVNGSNMERLRHQRSELELQLEGQRRLLEVNERLLSTLEPAGVLDLIADSLQAIVPYDSLTIYRVDRGCRQSPRGRRPRHVRRADPRPRDPARDRADRLGHRSRRGRPRQPGPPRSTLHPGPRHPVRARGDDHRPAVRQRPDDRHAQHRPDGRRRDARSARTSSSSPSCSRRRRRSPSRTPRRTAPSGSAPSSMR